MTANRPTLLQLCPLSPALEQGLNELFEVVRWFELDPAQQKHLLETDASSVRAVATGGHVGCPDDLMEALPNLGIVSINGVGFDKVDLALARARGVRVTTTPDVLTADVADLAVGLTIGLLRGITPADRHVREGEWVRGERPLMRRVSGSRFGIVGLGRIGRATADRLSSFGPIRYHSPTPKDAPYERAASLAELAEWADVLVVTCNANEATRGLIGADILDRLGASGYLVNVARGSVIDEPALIEALQQRTIAGAALDVFADEPRVPQALIDSERVLLTPHIASATAECRAAMSDLVLANLRAFLDGRPLPSPVA